MHQRGFTFVEILIAILIATLLAGVVCTALIQIARTERSAGNLREAAFRLQTVACRSYLDQNTPKEISALFAPEWSADAPRDTVDDERGETPWVTWHLVPDESPDRAYSISLRAGRGAW
jgi:prepilin-type N-terminal cleavage/methylation domain-containing protein